MRGVSLNVALGDNGLITQAQRAADLQERAMIEERIHSVRLGVEMQARSENRKPTVAEYLSALEEAGLVGDYEEMEGGYAVVTNDGYAIEIGTDSSGHLTVVIGEKDEEILARQIQILSIAGQAIGSTGGRVTLTTNGAVGVNYTYEAISGGETKETITTTSRTATFKNLEPSTIYDVKVSATGKGTHSLTQTGAITTGSVPAGLNNITGIMEWNSSTHTAKVRIATEITGYTIK